MILLNEHEKYKSSCLWYLHNKTKRNPAINLYFYKRKFLKKRKNQGCIIITQYEGT